MTRDRVGEGLGGPGLHLSSTSPRAEATEIAMFVRTSSEEVVKWNRERIVNALIRETDIDAGTAEQIGLEVEEQLFRSSIKVVTAPLVRELVNSKLVEHGLEEARRYHTRLGVPLYDVNELILHPNKENANVPHGPEGTNLTLAESIKKEYALLTVFSQAVADAHLSGDIHLHDLGFIDRPYCSGQSLEYVKKYGLSLPNALSIAKPAKHPEVLLAHMVKFSAALQGHFAGAIGWDAVNLFFAPYITEMSDRDLHQLAQILIFEYSQQAVARGGQAIFSDLNLYWEVPKHFREVDAIGPGGTYTGKKYKDYEKDAQRFVWALFDIYMDGDGSGRPFFFPKPLVHMTEDFFKTDGHEKFLHHICEVASKMGNTYFVFDRGETAKISECCRLSFKLTSEDIEDAKQPWKMRFCALQNVTTNLPRIAYEADGNDTVLFQRLTELMKLAAEAHMQKRIFIEKLLALGDTGPLALLTMKKDDVSYLRLNKASYLMGMVGLDDMVYAHIGEHMHESKRALKFGLQVTAHMRIMSDRLTKKHNMKFVLEQTPAESTAYRFAKLDLEHFPSMAAKTVKGSLDNGGVYYTNSTLFDVGAPTNPIERVRLEGMFHPLIEAGAISHLWLGEQRPSAESLANFVVKVFKFTDNDQIAFSPEFTTCNDCQRTTRGLLDECPYCHSKNVDGITRITGYFTKVSSWNLGKKAELRDRHRNMGLFNGSNSQYATGLFRGNGAP
ncbi:MAG TPA: anaerobic ribonucleoside-triphosphate reductase [bacterium]|nr:anaerobic ribonucleoside-triphosphate reductase [bacterium]